MQVTSSPRAVAERAAVIDGEPQHKRLTRNLHELLQELRVTQTGVQILTGFLLTLPFSARFTELSTTQRHVYLAVLAGSVVSTGLMTSGAVWLVCDIVADGFSATLAGAASLLFFLTLWVVYPLAGHRGAGRAR